MREITSYTASVNRLLSQSKWNLGLLIPLLYTHIRLKLQFSVKAYWVNFTLVYITVIIWIITRDPYRCRGTALPTSSCSPRHIYEEVRLQLGVGKLLLNIRDHLIPRRHEITMILFIFSLVTNQNAGNVTVRSILF